MICFRIVAVGSLAVLLGGQAVAQTPFRYREYTLGSSTAAVLKTSNMREDAVKTLHDGPARIQQLEWRAPYVFSGTERADPVRDIVFSFYDDQLYQVLVTYDRDRLVGLTNDDLIESISATYGVPLLRHAASLRTRRPIEVAADATVAQWDDAGSMLTLTRDTYSAQVQLALLSKPLHAKAREAIEEAVRSEARDAPQRERDRRSKELTDVRAATDKARVVNKAAFRP